MHTESLARTLYAQRMFDWLDETLGTAQVSSSPYPSDLASEIGRG